MAEGVCEHGGSDFEIESKKEDQRADRHGILHHRRDRSERLEQLSDRKGRGEDVIANGNIDFELIGVEQDRAAGFNFGGVALDGILIERDERVQVIALRIGFLLAQPQPQPDVAAANDRLIAIKSIGI